MWLEHRYASAASTHRIQHRPMLRRHRHDMPSTHTFDREIVRFRRAAGEHDLPRRRAGKLRDPLASCIYGLLRLPAEQMAAARRIAEFRPEIRQHGVQYPGVDGRRRMVIEVDRLVHGRYSILRRNGAY